MSNIEAYVRCNFVLCDGHRTKLQPQAKTTHHNTNLYKWSYVVGRCSYTCEVHKNKNTFWKVEGLSCQTLWKVCGSFNVTSCVFLKTCATWAKQTLPPPTHARTSRDVNLCSRTMVGPPPLNVRSFMVGKKKLCCTALALFGVQVAGAVGAFLTI